jgi:hypothetical protein
MLPGEKVTIPPPASSHAFMAACMALVFKVIPSGTAPKSVVLKTAAHCGVVRAPTSLAHSRLDMLKPKTRRVNTKKTINKGVLIFIIFCFG